MLTVSNEFKSAIKELSVYSDGKVDIVNIDGTLSFDRDDISSIEIYGSAFSNDKVLGNIAQHSLTLELLGDVTSSISLLKENVCKVDIGVKVGVSYEYVRFQDFIITSIDYNDTNNITKIVGTDYCVKLNKEYIDTNTYPITLKDYLIDVLNQCGLLLENTTFLNDDFVIASKPINDYTSIKEVIRQILELSLGFGIINKVSNKFEIRNAFEDFRGGYTHEELSSFTHLQLKSFTHYELEYGTSNDFITKDNYWNLKLKTTNFGTLGVNTLVLKNSKVVGENNTVENAPNVAIDGAIEVSILDNAFIPTEALRLSIIGDMFDVLDGYSFTPYTLEYRGFPYLELGDVVAINKMSEEFMYSPIYDYTIRYDGGLYGKIGASVLSLSETKYRNTQTLSQRVKQAEIIVDKVEGEVTILAGDYYDGKLEGAKYVFDGTNATFYGGGLKIKNNLDEDVFYADISGNLTIVGDLKSYKDDILRVELTEDRLEFFNTNGNSIVKMSTSSDTLFMTTDVNSGSSNYVTFSMWDNATFDIFSCSMQAWGVGSVRSMVQSVSSSTGASAVISASNNIDKFTDIRARSNGQIELYSSSESYLIYIGGTYKSIIVDGSGFLKAT